MERWRMNMENKKDENNEVNNNTNEVNNNNNNINGGGNSRINSEIKDGANSKENNEIKTQINNEGNVEAQNEKANEIQDEKLKSNMENNIKIVTGNGENLTISQVYDHIDVEKPITERSKEKIVVPEEKKNINPEIKENEESNE